MLEARTSEALQKYAELARKLGYPAEFQYDMGTDIVETATRLVENVSRKYPEFHGLRRPVGLPSTELHPPPHAQRNSVRHPAGAALEGDHDGHPADPDQYLRSGAVQRSLGHQSRRCPPQGGTPHRYVRLWTTPPPESFPNAHARIAEFRTAAPVCRILLDNRVDPKEGVSDLEARGGFSERAATEGHRLPRRRRAERARGVDFRWNLHPDQGAPGSSSP